MGEIKRQSINNTVLSYAGAGLGFLLIYLQPLLISSSDIGLIRLIFSFSWMVAIIMPFGLGSIVVRFFPRIQNHDNVHNGFFGLLFLIGSAGALIIAALMYLNKIHFVEYYKNAPAFPVYFEQMLLLAYLLSLISIYSTYSSSLLRTTFTVFLTDVFTRLGHLVVVLLYYFDVINRHGFVMGYMSIFFLQLVLLIIYLFRSKSVSLKINYSFFKTLGLKEVALFGLVMMATSFASLGIKFIDQLMIGHFLSSDMVGVYATCVMMCVIMEIPFTSLERIANPKVSAAWSTGNHTEVAKIYEMSSRYLFFVGGLLFCLLWAGLDLIFYYLPLEYHQGKMAFYIVSFSSLFNLLTGVNSTVIMYSHKYFAASFFLFLLILISYLANNLLIPRYGITGAAEATLIAIGSFNLLKYLYILIRFKMQPFSLSTLYIGLCILCAASLILLLPATLHVFLRTLIGGAFTLLIFSIVNIKFNIIEEVNKLFRRLKIIR